MNDAGLVEAAPELETLSELEQRICAGLTLRGRLRDADLVRARKLYAENPEGGFIAFMTRLGLLSERDAAEGVADVLQLPLVTSKEFP
ncbi:MAG: hypothetical protein ABIP49_02890, partial [Lysobacterales bacterium]